MCNHLHKDALPSPAQTLSQELSIEKKKGRSRSTAARRKASREPSLTHYPTDALLTPIHAPPPILTRPTLLSNPSKNSSISN